MATYTKAQKKALLNLTKDPEAQERMIDSLAIVGFDFKLVLALLNDTSNTHEDREFYIGQVVEVPLYYTYDSSFKSKIKSELVSGFLYGIIKNIVGLGQSLDIAFILKDDRGIAISVTRNINMSYCKPVTFL